MATITFDCFALPVQGDDTGLGSTLELLVIRPGAYPLPQTLKQYGQTINEMRVAGTITQTTTTATRTIAVDDTL